MKGVAKFELSREERALLRQCEDEIEKSLPIILKHGRAIGERLITIRDQRLYREKHRTFEQYCQQKFKISRPRAYQLCREYEMVKKLEMSNALDKDSETVPSSRALQELDKSPEAAQAEVLEEAKKSGKVTKPSVKAAAKKVAARKGTPERIKDKANRDIPERALPIWRRRGEIREKLAPLYDLDQFALDMQGTEDPLWTVRGLKFANLSIAIRSVIFQIKQALPDRVCTKCQGIKSECEFCYGRGMISNDLADGIQTPVEMKDMLKKLSRSNDQSAKLPVESC